MCLFSRSGLVQGKNENKYILQRFYFPVRIKPGLSNKIIIFLTSFSFSLVSLCALLIKEEKNVLRKYRELGKG